MVKLYVEGGGDASALKTACRKGFTTFIAKAGIGKRPRVVACGSRQDAYESFCTAIAKGEDALLLVDSEAPVAAQHQQGSPDTWHPWAHLNQRPGDGWDKPANTSDTDCHLMVQVMESWFLADRETLMTFFGQGFRETAMPAKGSLIEGIAKTRVYEALANATRNCKVMAPYGKGEHSFKLLASIDPAKVIAASPWAKRLVEGLAGKMGA